MPPWTASTPAPPAGEGCLTAAVAHGRVRVRRRPAAAAVRVYVPAVDVRVRRLARGDRPDGEYRAGLHAQVLLGADAGPCPPPGPLARFGRRRGWLLAIQPALVAGVRLLALSDPGRAPANAVAAAALVAFLRRARTSSWMPGASRLPRPAPGRGDGGLCLGLSHRAADLRRGGDQVGGFPRLARRAAGRRRAGRAGSAGHAARPEPTLRRCGARPPGFPSGWPAPSSSRCAISSRVPAPRPSWPSSRCSSSARRWPA